jgi:hypothetical protein
MGTHVKSRAIPELRLYYSCKNATGRRPLYFEKPYALAKSVREGFTQIKHVRIEPNRPQPEQQRDLGDRRKGCFAECRSPSGQADGRDARAASPAAPARSTPPGPARIVSAAAAMLGQQQDFLRHVAPVAARARATDHARFVLRSERRLNEGAFTEPIYERVGVSLDESPPCRPVSELPESHGM